MSVLSTATQKQVEEQLVKDKLVTQEQLTTLKKKAAEASVPFFTQLVNEKVIDNESLTKTIARVNKVAYVNLLTAGVDKKTLELLPRDVAERYMAVPLGEMQHR